LTDPDIALADDANGGRDSTDRANVASARPSGAGPA